MQLARWLIGAKSPRVFDRVCRLIYGTNGVSLANCIRRIGIERIRTRTRIRIRIHTPSSASLLIDGSANRPPTLRTAS